MCLHAVGAEVALAVLMHQMRKKETVQAKNVCSVDEAAVVLDFAFGNSAPFSSVTSFFLAWFEQIYVM